MTAKRPKNLVAPVLVLAAALLLVPGWAVTQASSARATVTPFPMPEFTQSDEEAWFNSPPLAKADLAGKVVLVDFWTFECWNCYRSFPWLNALESRFEDHDLVVIGVHTPEFEHEKEPDRVAAKIAEFELHHPVMMDNDFRYWRAMDNFAWPAFYLVDRKGQVRQRFIGETHEGDRRARDIESAIESLLAESGN